MDGTVLTAEINSFIDSITDLVNTNLGLVLGFAAAIIVWGVAKKWLFGGTARI